MSDLKKLQADSKSAEKAAQALMAEKDEAMQKVRDKYWKRLQDANDKAAAAQKEWMDAEAAQALMDRDELSDDGKRALADSLGLTLPE